MLISLVVPAREWDGFLEATLASIRNLVVPSDTSVEVVVGLAGQAPPVLPEGVRVVPNPSGTIPDGLNRAIGASSGDVVVRVDARCDLQPDHLVRVLDRLDDPQVGCVGGAQLVLDRGVFGSTYAIAFNSMLLGPTVYRYRRTSGPADTAYLGAWRRSVLEAAGGFDPRLIRNQDNELADRVRALDMVVWYDADLVIGYHNARGLAGALAHHHEFGLWRMVQREQGQRGLTGRHVASLGLLGAGGLLGLGALSDRRSRPSALKAAAAAYVVAGAVAWRSARRLRRARPDIRGPRLHPLAPVLAPALAAALDGAWLAGVVRGALSRQAVSEERPLDR